MLVSDERFADMILEGLTDDHDMIKHGKRYPEYNLDEVEVTMRKHGAKIAVQRVIRRVRSEIVNQL